MVKYDGLLDELRTMLPEYMAQRGQVVGSAGKRKICCINPLHQDKTPSMSYFPKNKKLHCFGCGKSYDLFDVIALDYSECDSFPRQVRKACELFSVSFPEDFGHSSEGKKATLLVRPAARGAESEALCIPGDCTAFVEAGIAAHGSGGGYFVKRGISPALCEKYRLFEDGIRAFLPVFLEGRCLSYSARAISDELEPRYKNSAGPMRFFGEDRLLSVGPSGRGGVLVVTEAIFDALSAEECGFPAVALGGAGNVQRFLSLCAQNPGTAASYQFLAAGDADKAGRRMNAALLEGLRELGLSCAQVVLPEGAKDLNEALLQNREGLKGALEAAADADAAAYGRQSASWLLEELLDTAKLRGLRRPVQTGFSRLDGLLDGGLYTGLYVLGAVTSLGKTSFLLQMADTIAENGTDILYFTLEMSRRELIAKSLSRLTRSLDPDAARRDAFTARDILRMDTETMPARRKALLSRSAQAYGEGAGTRLFYFEGVSSMDAAGICELTRRHIRMRGTRPVVIVDYLQILKPADGRATDKQNTDRAVVELKRLSRDCDLPILVISSFNRENYKNAVSMEAFKESGAVEYSSDVLLGLQYTGMGEREFDINKARSKAAREVELVILKNRNGVAYAKIPFRYEAPYSSFKEFP